MSREHRLERWVRRIMRRDCKPSDALISMVNRPQWAADIGLTRASINKRRRHAKRHGRKACPSGS